MTRHYFGATLADFVVAPGDTATVGGITGFQTLLVPSISVTFWDSATAGTQLIDLLDSLGPATSITTDAAGAIPAFQGPDDGTLVMWADADGGDGSRKLMIATDLPDALAAAIASVASNSAAIAALAPIATSGDWSDLAGVPAFADVATSGLYSDLAGTPSPGLQYVVKAGGTWPLRSSTAPDPARPCSWRGAAPAPPAGGGYALPFDTWDAFPA